MLPNLVYSQSSTAAQSQAEVGASAGQPRNIRFSSGVRAADGTVRTGVVAVTFSLYSEPQGESPIWIETQNVTLDENGRYSVLLGATSGEGLPTAIFAAGQARWLGTRIAEEGAAEQPRVQLVSVPYALAAADAQSLGGRPATDFQLTRAAAATTGDGSAPGPVDSAAINNGATNGTANFLSKFDGATTIVNSAIVEVGGRFGLGTSTPNFQMDIQNADVSAAGANLFRIQSPSVNGATMHFISTSANGRHWGFGANFILGNGEFGIYDYTAGQNRLYIDNAGRVGLGTNSPAFGLDVRNNDASGAGSALMRLQTPSVNGALIRFISTSANGHDYGFGSNFILGTGEFGVYDYTANTSRLMIAGSGNVGIGTSSPSQKMEVAGTIYSSSGGFRFPDGTTQTTAASGGGAGDITGVTAGTGLSGGGLAGDVTLSVNTVAIQARVTGTCNTGQYIRIIGADGNVTCGTDATSGGGGGETSFSGSTASGLVTSTQANAVVINEDPTYASAQTGIPAALVGKATSAINTAAGVAGFASSPNSPAIVGWNGSTTVGAELDAQGVLGISDNPTGIGVSGEAHSVTGLSVGVRGTSDSTSGAGLAGFAGADTGTTMGVYAQVMSANGTAGNFLAPTMATATLLRGGNGGADVFRVDGTGAVYASAYKDLAGNPISGGGGGDITGVTAGTGLTGGGASGAVSLAVDSTVARNNANNNFTTSQNITGNVTATGVVFGLGGNFDGPDGGILGRDTINDGGFRIGVQGYSASTGGTGLYGRATATTGLTSGVYGRGDSDSSAAVYGIATSATGFTAGIRGISQSPSGAGVRGDNMPNVANTAVAAGFGMRGSFGLNKDFSVNTLATGGIALFGENFAPAGTALQAEAKGSGSTIGLYAKATSANGTAAVIDNSAGGVILSAKNNGAEKLRVDGSGNVVVNGGDLSAIVQGKGIILRATDGSNCFRITVNNGGALTTSAVTCPI